MLSVVCVLKSGGEYGPKHVAALRDGVQANLKAPHKFICLSDLDAANDEADTVDLEHDWPGWFSKIELFRPNIFDGPVFYLDLDTVIVGPLDDLVEGHTFTVLENFWAKDRIGSGLMAWNVDLSEIYKKFASRAAFYMRDYVTKEKWGDQGFIRWNTPVVPQKWQTKFPGRVVSYKFHVRQRGEVPQGASVVCYHGKPRPWQTKLWKTGA